MKAGIHPKVMTCQVKCTCGNSFELISDRETMHVDLCSECHPFFTGQQKFVDSAGRVDRFAQRYATNLSLNKLAQRDDRKKDLSKLTHKINPKVKKDAPRREEGKEGAAAAPAAPAKGGAKSKK